MLKNLEFIILQLLILYWFWSEYFSGKSKLSDGGKIRLILPFIILEIFILYNLIKGKSILDWIVEFFNK